MRVNACGGLEARWIIIWGCTDGCGRVEEEADGLGYLGVALGIHRGGGEVRSVWEVQRVWTYGGADFMNLLYLF